MYKEELFDHYKHPRHYGALQEASFICEEANPSCGDQVQLFVQLHEDSVQQMTFIGKGCVISQAASSLFVDYCHQKKIVDLLALDATFMKQLVGIELGLTRLQCALLPLVAFKKGIMHKQEEESCLIDQNS